MNKNLLRFVFPIIIVVLLSSFAWHKFYVSVTQIDYVPSKKRIEITHRIFIDDLEKALEKKYKKKVYLTSKISSARQSSIFHPPRTVRPAMAPKTWDRQ